MEFTVHVLGPHAGLAEALGDSFGTGQVDAKSDGGRSHAAAFVFVDRALNDDAANRRADVLDREIAGADSGL